MGSRLGSNASQPNESRTITISDKVAPSAGGAQQVSVCHHWKAKGHCKLGDACKFLHPQEKKGVGTSHHSHRAGRHHSHQSPHEESPQPAYFTAPSAMGTMSFPMGGVNPFAI